MINTLCKNIYTLYAYIYIFSMTRKHIYIFLLYALYMHVFFLYALYTYKYSRYILYTHTYSRYRPYICSTLRSLNKLQYPLDKNIYTLYAYIHSCPIYSPRYSVKIYTSSCYTLYTLYILSLYSIHIYIFSLYTLYILHASLIDQAAIPSRQGITMLIIQ